MASDFSKLYEPEQLDTLIANIRKLLDDYARAQDKPHNPIDDAAYGAMTYGGYSLCNLATKLRGLKEYSEITMGEATVARKDTLDALRQIHSFNSMTSAVSEDAQKAIIVRARLLNSTWKEIGHALGVSAQAIHRRVQEKGWMPFFAGTPDD